VVVSDQDQDAELRQRQIIGRLRQRHPDWMIMYGTYSQMFWAYPLFTTLSGNYVGAADPSELDRRMTAAEANLLHNR
jgi:hypothetical protein